MQYMQWSNGNAELDRMKRYCIAYEYVQAEKIRDNAVQGLEELKNKISEIDNGAEKMLEEIQVMEKKVSELSAEKEASMGGEVKLLSEKVDSLSRDLVKATSVLKNQEDILMTEKENAAKIERNLEELKQSEEEKARAVKIAEDGAVDLKRSSQELSKSLEEHEKEYQGVLAVADKNKSLRERPEGEKQPLLIKKHILASPAASGALRSVTECIQISLGHCCLLEARGLALTPILLMQPKLSLQPKLSSSAHRFSTMVQVTKYKWLLMKLWALIN
ncbi:Structural maintenance of chromosomes protein 2-1 [Abeliophyllum distichum]|uniref:Structural maintenance of chromosomes protein 2-1 n=1 Tax=Abeliophyllum distichum TaxID=126358 RepID=A0ABD1R9V2_9LAMI